MPGDCPTSFFLQSFHLVVEERNSVRLPPFFELGCYQHFRDCFFLHPLSDVLPFDVLPQRSTLLVPLRRTPLHNQSLLRAHCLKVALSLDRHFSLDQGKHIHHPFLVDLLLLPPNPRSFVLRTVKVKHLYLRQDTPDLRKNSHGCLVNLLQILKLYFWMLAHLVPSSIHLNAQVSFDQGA